MSRNFVASVKERRVGSGEQPSWFIQIEFHEAVDGLQGDTLDIDLARGTVEKDAVELARMLNFVGAKVSVSGIR